MAAASPYFTSLLKGDDKEGYIQAIKAEHNSFLEKEVYQTISPKELKGKKPIPIKVILSKKTDTNGKFPKHKARFVCQGSDKSGIDFDPFEITSSVPNLKHKDFSSHKCCCRPGHSAVWCIYGYLTVY